MKVTTIKLTHGNSFYDCEFKEESNGTRSLFELLDILLNKSENKVYVIDEMERSLHPKLTSRFIELYIYSLDKFKERYDKKLSKAYLEGRYGAIPVFTSFSFKKV